MIEVSPAELIDKLTILEIRSERINDPDKRANINLEHRIIAAVDAASIIYTDDVTLLRAKLRSINEKLWDIEDKIRECERRRDFGPDFIELARSVYKTNDERAVVKREINVALQSLLVEEKSYSSY